ncbi:hypothetical protein BHE74_00054554 [Ensete ventricosum]|nr:hypothetical protein BHE74_00054554 [Ensete ventricosum]RZR94910.1 hypothetical protein BHM03_00023694 [Ensete ventricosum]
MTLSGLHAVGTAQQDLARERCEVSTGLGVLVVHVFFTRSMVGYLQEKTFVGVGPLNEASSIAKLAL